jgi:membrane fusion protein (multidrug efflux system)
VKRLNEMNPAELNGKSVAVLEKPSAEVADVSDKIAPTPVAAPETKAIAPIAEIEQKPLPPVEEPKKKRPNLLILGILGIGAIAAGNFGYRYWQYASSHIETDNATVTGHSQTRPPRLPS